MTITRYEEKSDALFICINHTEKPVYIEHFFTEEERLDDASRKATIEKLVAELEIKADEYIEPEKFINKTSAIKNIKLDRDKIKKIKAEILLKRKDGG